MNPLPDRTVIVGLLATLGLCFALVFWFVRLNPSSDGQMLWREAPSRPSIQKPTPASGQSRTNARFSRPGSGSRRVPRLAVRFRTALQHHR
jgi:hypothetical protein